MAGCKWMQDEICVNADCPVRGDYCPVVNNPGVCRFEAIAEKELTETDCEFLLAYAKYNMQLSETARQIAYSRNAVKYHLDQVKVKTGLSPYNFYDLVKLVQMCQKKKRGV